MRVSGAKVRAISEIEDNGFQKMLVKKLTVARVSTSGALAAQETKTNTHNEPPKINTQIGIGLATTESNLGKQL